MKHIAIPTLPLTGGCQCGAVRYRLEGSPLAFFLCHCTECQRHTSSAFGESLRCVAADLHIEGRLETFARISEAGNRREGRFCPSCGVRIVHGTAGSDEANIKAGTLDDTSWLVPAGHIWTRSKQRFVTIGEDELSYEAQPGDGYAGLIERWREMVGEG